MLKLKAALLAGALAISSGAIAQSLEFGPNGVRVDRDRDRVERNYRNDRGGIDRREAISIARQQGVRDVGDVRESRSGFTVDGRDRRGDDILVRISQRGEVLDVRRD